MAVVCTNCGAESSSGSVCVHCGTPLPEASPSQAAGVPPSTGEPPEQSTFEAPSYGPESASSG
jgi:hypothetical protein